MSADSSAVRSLLERVIGPQADRFTLILCPVTDGEFFEVSASRGEVRIGGTTLSALARGSYHYLKQACRVQFWPESSGPSDEHRIPVSGPDPSFEGVRSSEGSLSLAASRERGRVEGLRQGAKSPQRGERARNPDGSLGAIQPSVQDWSPSTDSGDRLSPGTKSTPEGSRTTARRSKAPGRLDNTQTWTREGPQNIRGVVLPEALPDFERQRVDCPNRLRYYLSVCTFGYSTAWWDWARWELEIDWMALHGINMPLALNGQEMIWQRVFRKLGLSDSQIEPFFSGPAYLPWHRLGNLDGYMGPLSQDWIQRQAELQHQILGRERELGMTTVVPGFSGFVPPSFSDLYPNVRLRSAEPWAGFSATTYIDPLDPMFVEVGALFVEEYREEFGVAHHYLCETFAEQLPQIEPGQELAHLRAIGASTWESLHRSDPDCHWVMQGWPFHFGREYWTPERAEALFDAIPDGRLIVLDQVTEAYEVWRNQPTVRDRGWIHCAVHNYGQNTHLHGDLAGFAERAGAALSSQEKGRMLGMGIMPEGIDQNPVVYELLTDLMWSPAKIDVGEWVHDYVRSRYGSDNPHARQAWKLLLESIYGKGLDRTLRCSWRHRPGDQPILADLDLPKARGAVERLLEASDELHENPRYVRDFVDVAKTWLGGIADCLLEQALGDPGNHEKQTRFYATLLDLDKLQATLPEHRLSTWLANAQRAAPTPTQADLFEHNARSLITHWGGPFLFDYAIREWAGLIQDFHVERWRRHFAGTADLAEWERAWAASTAAPKESDPGDPIEIVEDLLARYPAMASTRTACHDHGLLIGENLIEIDLAEPRLLTGIAVFPMFGQGFKGRYSIEISEDGMHWRRVHTARVPTCRGSRAAFGPIPVRSIRIEIDPVQGDPTQQFQVLTFEPATL